MIVPDQPYKVTVSEGVELFIDGRYDSLHYYEPLDAHWLRYQDPKNNRLCMVMANETLVDWILEDTDIPYVIRETVYESEHDLLVGILGGLLVNSELDFDYEIPEGEIDEEVEDE